MRYYAQYNENKKLIAIGTGYGGTEITEAEYNELLAKICEKADLIDKLYSGEITIDAVPAEWREEIQRRVDERIAAEGEAAEQEVSGEEFMTMLEGVL
ncbi:MAG: addiction module protein [Muribaculaceae bacterium]|nr:addiction module protein [Muribaculaceae bacterium]